MKRSRLSLVALLLTAVLPFWACGEGDSGTNPEQEPLPTIPSQATFTVQVPTNAPPQVKGYVLSINNLVNAGFTWITAAANHQPSGSGGQYEWKATVYGVSVSLKAVVNRTTSEVQWTLTLDGTDQISGTTYNNWVAMTGTTDLQAKNGQVTLYEINTSDVAGQLAWTTRDNGERTINATSPDGSSWAVNLASDGSGSLVVMQYGNKVFEASWDSNGAGTWASYDPFTGQQTGSGSWSA